MEIFHTIDVTLIYEWGLATGQEFFCLISMSSNPLLVRNYNSSGSLGFWGNFAKFTIELQSLLRDWLQISHQVMRKIVLHIVSFAYSLLSLLLSLVVVLLFSLLSY